MLHVPSWTCQRLSCMISIIMWWLLDMDIIYIYYSTILTALCMKFSQTTYTRTWHSSKITLICRITTPIIHYTVQRIQKYLGKWMMSLQVAICITTPNNMTLIDYTFKLRMFRCNFFLFVLSFFIHSSKLFFHFKYVYDTTIPILLFILISLK